MKVSVIVPVYNAEKYIKDVFYSIANQTYKNIEAIFVDDCSTDNSYSILSELKELQKDSEIQYKIIRREKNSGVHISRNTGIKEALRGGDGNYIFFIDHDDIITPNCIECLLSSAEKYPNAEIIQGANIAFDEDTFSKLFSWDMTKEIWDIICKDIIVENNEEEILNEIEIIKFWLYNLQFYKNISLLGVWATLYKTDFIKDKNIFFSEDLPNTQDVYFRYLCFKNAMQIVIKNTPIIYFYRLITTGSLSTHKDQYQRKCCWAICLEKMLLDADNEEYSQLLLRWCFEWTKFWAGKLETEKEKTLISRYLNILKKIKEKIA